MSFRSAIADGTASPRPDPEALSVEPDAFRDHLMPLCRDGDPPEWDILSIDSAEVVCEGRLGGVVKSFVRRVA